MRWFLASGLFLAAHVSSGRGFSLSRSSLSYLNQLLTQRITPTRLLETYGEIEGGAPRVRGVIAKD